LRRGKSRACASQQHRIGWYRRRVAAGRATFRIEASVVDLEFFLVGAGLLRPGDADCSVVETALAKLIEQLTTSNA
jgi:hypothetical protein